jgi:predicted nucleotidyltransferase
MEPLSERLQKIAGHFAELLSKKKGGELVSVVLFGSVARLEATIFSDMDLLLVFKELPPGREARFKYLGDYPPKIESALHLLWNDGIYCDIVPHIKTKLELTRRTPFLYEICKDAVPLFDPTHFFRDIQKTVMKRAQELGTKWVQQGRFRYLDLKPDCKPGEVFEL